MAGGCAQNSILGALLTRILHPDLIICWRIKLSKEFRYLLQNMHGLNSFFFFSVVKDVCSLQWISYLSGLDGLETRFLGSFPLKAIPLFLVACL